VITGTEYRYVGKHPIENDRVIIYKVSGRHLGFELPEFLCIKQPMKTVWVNLYKSGISFCCWYDTEEQALKEVTSKGDHIVYIGTFPIEIPA
jgi:hypothetical protein